MPIGFSYPVDTVIEDADLFLGTKTTRNTVNYPAQSIADYLNINGKISITGQMSFKFVIINGIAGTISFDGGGGNNTLFSSIDNLIVSLADVSGQQVNVFLDYLIDSEILLAHQNEINSFGNYKITNYTVTGNPGFYSLDLEYIGGNGSIVKDEYYDIVSFNSSSGSTPYTLPVASSTVLGGVKIGTGVNIAIDGVISVNTDYVPTDRTITINGIDQDLFADRNWDVGDLLSTGSYADPTWITSLAYTKLTGAPTIPSVTPSALTKTDDTNVTLTLGGTPSTSLLQATSLALGWTGQLSIARGGTGLGTLGTANQLIRVNSGATALEYFTPTYLTSAVTSISATSPITSSGGTTPIISTSMATNKLIGRYSTGTGVMQEIAIGDGLTLTAGGQLNNTATATPLGYYGAWQDLVTQTAASSNVGYPFIFRTIDLENQVRVVTNGTNLTRITFDNTGIYNLQFSAQIQNTDNAQHDVAIWIRKNGVDVAGSAGFISVPARKSAGAGNEGHGVFGWNYLLSIVAGEYYEIVWSTTNATHITIQYYSGSNPPPSTASVLATVTQQSGIMAGTGITGLGKAGSIQTGAVQTLAVGTSGTNFDIVSSGNVQTFNLPTASAVNRGALSSADWTTFNNKQTATQAAILATLGWYNYKNTTSSSTLTGTLTETQLLQVTIPANTFSASDFLKYTTAFSKTGILGNCIFRFKLSTSSTMPSGTTGQIGIYTMGSNILYVAVDGRLTIKGGNITGMPFTQNTNVPTTPSALALSSVAFDPTVTQYFYVSATLGSITDSVFLNSTQITNI